MKQIKPIQMGSVAIALLIFLMSAVSALSFTSALGANQFQDDMKDKLTQYAVLNLEDQVLLESAGIDDTFHPVGSLRNLMTAYIASKELSMSRKIVVGDEVNDLAADVITFGLQEGDQVSVKDLIATMMLGGGQDSALVLAANLAETPEDFVKSMNETAAELGMSHTVYTVDSDDEAETSTLHDLLILGTEISQNSKQLCDILSQATIELDQADNSLPKDVSSRVLLLNPTESTYNENVSMGMGYGSSRMELHMLVAAKCGEQDVVIAVGSNVSSRRTFEAVNELIKLLEEKPYNKVDSTESFQQLLAGFEDGENLLEAEIPDGQFLYMSQDMEAGFDAKDLSVELVDKTQTKTIGEHYANASIGLEGEFVASFPMLLKGLTPEAEEASSQAATLVTERYTQADESYFPTTYDQYGWIFWSVAGVVMSVVVGIVASKILRVIC